MAERRKAPSLDLTKGAIWPQLAALFLPSLTCVALQELCALVDLSFVGQHASPTAYEALLATARLTHLVIGIAVSLGVGCSIIVSHHFGAKSGRRLTQATHTAAALSLAFGLIGTAVGVLAAAPLLRALGTPSELIVDALSFAYGYLGSFLPMVILNMGSALQRAVGDTRTPMRIMMLTFLADIGLDVLLVDHLAMGIRGAALATAGAYCLGSLITIVSLLRARAPWRLHPKRIRISPPMARDMLACALPLAVQAIAFSVTTLVTQSLVGSFGDQMASAWGISAQIGSAVWMVADALAMATITFAAQNFGAANYARMRRGLHVALVMTLVVVGCTEVLTCVFAPQVCALFENDRTIASLAATIVLLTVPFYLIPAWMDDVAGTIRGSGEGLWPMAAIVGGTCLLRILWMLLVVPRYHSILTAVASYPVTWLCTTLCFVVHYRHGRWITRSLRRARHLRADV